MNHFYRMWYDAERQRNDYVPTEVHWSEVPGRDELWKEQTIKNTSEQQFKIEFECEFLGSIDTLITASKLKSLVYEQPIECNGGLSVYEAVRKDHDYVVTVDVARELERISLPSLWLTSRSFHTGWLQSTGITTSNQCYFHLSSLKLPEVTTSIRSL